MNYYLGRHENKVKKNDKGKTKITKNLIDLKCVLNNLYSAVFINLD